MRSYRAILIIFFAVCALPVSATAADPLSKKGNQIELILRDASYDQKTRQMVYVAGRIAYVREAYTSNPKNFTIEKPIPAYADKTGVEMQSYVPSLDEVIRNEMEKMQAEGFIDKDLSSLKLGNDLIGLVPHPVVQLISGGVGVALDHVPTGGQPPVYSPDAAEYANLGDMIYTLAQEEGEIGETIRKQFKEWMGYSINEDLSGAPPVEKAREHATAEARYEEFKKLAQENNKGVKELLELHKQMMASNLEEAAKQKLAAQYEARRKYIEGEITGGLDMMSTVAGFFGDSDAARKFGALSKSTSMIMNTFSPESMASMGPMAMANVYVGAAMLVIQAFQSQEEANQMRALMEAIQQLREEMHQRFDIIDVKLDMIHRTLNQGFEAILNNQGRLQDNIALLQNSLEDYRVEMHQRLKALYDRYHQDEIALCLNLGFAMSEPLSATQFYQCLARIQNNMFRYSKFSYDDLASGPQSVAEASYESLEFPYTSALWPLVSDLRSSYQVPLPNPNMIYNMALWNKSARELIELWSLHPELTAASGDKPIADALQSGEEIKHLLSSLALENGGTTINTVLFEKMLGKYFDDMGSALMKVDGWVRMNDHGLHPGLPTDQSLEKVGLPAFKNNSIKACKDGTDWGVHEVTFIKYLLNPIQPTWVTTYRPTDHYTFPLPGMPTSPTDDAYAHTQVAQLQQSLAEAPPELPLWTNVYKSLPNEILWMESMQPGAVSFCFRKFRFNNLTFGYLPTEFSSNIHANFEQPRHIKADFEILIEVQLGNPANPSQEAAVMATVEIRKEAVSVPWNNRTIAPMKIYHNRPLLYKAFWQGHEHDYVYGQTHRLPGVLDSAWAEDGTGWAKALGIVEDIFALVQASLQDRLNALKPTMIANTMNTVEFKEWKKRVSETRNALKILLEIGINEDTPGRMAVLSLFQNSVETSQVLRELDVMLHQITTGQYTQEQILEQVKSAQTEFLNVLKRMNDAGTDLRPINRALERTLFDLRSLLKTEEYKAK